MEEARLVERPLDAKVNINGKEIHIPGLDTNATDHWAIDFSDGKMVSYYGDNTVRTSDNVHSKWYHDLKLGNASLSFDAKKMGHAIEVITPQWDGSRYNGITHSCHHFIDAAIDEYRKEGGQIHYHRSFSDKMFE